MTRKRTGRIVAAVGTATASGRAAGVSEALISSSEGTRRYETGRKIHDRPDKGGRRANDLRNIDMATEYLRRRLGPGKLSDSALMAEVGRAFGLKRRAAIESIKAGLRISCGKGG